jgi:hypothetical protein
MLQPIEKPMIYLSLIHYPVLNKNGEAVVSAITNLDIHDIARAARTYGSRRYFIVTPVKDQQALTEKIISHWTDGYGGEYNPSRRDALSIVRVADSIETVKSEIEKETGIAPKVVATSAKNRSAEGSATQLIRFEELRKSLATGSPHLIVFGTAWGLAPEIFDQVDWTLEPITGDGPYNHLSVRSAVTVVLDRLREKQ